MKPDSISFVVPCYNCSQTIDDTLASILTANLSDRDEIILVDDASTDDTYQKLVAYQANYPFIKVLRHFINKGSAAAGRNTGIDHSANELIFCLDADNLLYPNSIQKLKNFLLTNQLDAAAFGRIDYFIDTTSNIVENWNLTEKLDFVPALNDPMSTPCGSGNFLYTKAIWKRVDRYNESLGGAYDSELFGLKLLASGAKFWTLPGEGYLHRKGYVSTFLQQYDKRNASLLFLAGLIDYWDQIHEDDRDYIFGKGRKSWMDNLSARPLRAAGDKSKTRVNIPGYPLKIIKKLLRYLPLSR